MTTEELLKNQGYAFYDYGADIKWNSEPIYDYWFWQFNKPSQYWSAEDWMTWHKRLVEHFGLEKANEYWKAAIEKMDFFEHGTSWFKYNQDFVNYFATQGIDIGNVVSKSIVSAENIFDDITNFAESFSSGLKWIVPAVGIIIVVASSFYFYHKVKSKQAA